MGTIYCYGCVICNSTLVVFHLENLCLQNYSERVIFFYIHNSDKPSSQFCHTRKQYSQLLSLLNLKFVQLIKATLDLYQVNQCVLNRNQIPNFTSLYTGHILHWFYIIMMVKNLSVAACVLLAVLLSSALSSRVPVPTCNSAKINLQTFPISLNQTQRYDMMNFFSGYNLNITLIGKPEFVTLREKMTVTKISERPQPGLKNYHLSHNGNQWGDALVTISVEDNNATRLRWGESADNSSSIPDLTNELVVETDPMMTCYDAVWFRTQMIAMVDCANHTGKGLQNIFIYVNTSTKTVISKLNNSMYVPFSEIRHRKIQLMTENGYHYLIRAHFAEYVDNRSNTNTYLQVLSVNNPLKPWTVKVMDRSFLHQDRLSITDFEVYLGDVYILDFYSGVIKFDITSYQTILIVGRYRTDSGFTKLGVYSNNMDNEFLLVLAHDHAIFEVDWSNQIAPEIVAKYSIPDGAWIHDLWVNEQYVVVQLSANLTDEKSVPQPTQSTYVFNRGTRTYLNAFAAVPHVTFQAFVDFNRLTSQLLTIDTRRMQIIQLNNPTLILRPENSDLLDNQFGFVVKALSTNEYTGENLPCTFSFKFKVVRLDDMGTYPTGRNLPDTYYANYPGQLFIPLDRYIFGSNLTYGVYDKYDQQVPISYILQQNTTKLYWNKTPSVAQYVFLRQEQYDSLDETVLYLYTQDANNVTHFSRCTTFPFSNRVDCAERGFADQINFRIANITANRFLYYQSQYLHFVAILYRDLPNQVFVYDVQRNATAAVKPIQFPSGPQGKIASIQFLGHYLVVVLRYMKQIVFFDMNQCYDSQSKDCQVVFRINAEDMTKIGVNYFSPVQVYVSDFHPYVLFVQCLDRVVIVDITRTGFIKLAEIMSPATQEPGFYKWQMAIARGELILVNPPNIIEEHDLNQLYTMRNVTITKTFPTYSYVIPDKFDLDFSDTGNLVYITAKDPKLPATKSAVILVYRTGYPAVSSFYDVFNLEGNYQDVLIDATGSFGDYVAVTFGTELSIFRQYEIPIIVFEDTFADYSFNLTYANDPQQTIKYLPKCTVKVGNYPQKIIINDTKLNNNNYLTDSLKYDNDAKWYVFDDETWFNGSVLNYTLKDCAECNDKIKVINHVEEERELLGTLNMADYAFAAEGGFIQQFQSIIRMKHNGSIDQFVTFPSVLDGEQCMVVEHSWIYDFTLSACKQGEAQVYLYTTVYSAFKPFVNGPYYSSAKHVTSMHLLQELMIIVDVDENPWRMDREGGVIIYAINHDPYEPELFDELEVIDTNDLNTATDWPGGPCFIGNAHFAWTNMTDLYRLVITELNSGFFVVDFKWVKNRKSVEILKIEFIDMKEQMVKKNVPMPNGAFFSAIAINKEYFDTDYNYWQSEVIVSTSNFHSFQVNLEIDMTGTVTSHEIVKIFYRYGFYQNQNYIKTFDGYFAIPQRLPALMEPFDFYSPMVLSVYDTREHWTFNQAGEVEKRTPRYLEGTKVQIEYMLGGYSFSKGKVTFDWNFTLTRNASDPYRRLGLLALHARDARIRELRVHQKLIIQTLPGISSDQSANLTARNDFHSIDIPFKLILQYHDDSASFPGWAIALIVIGAVAVLGAGGYVILMRSKKGRPNRESEVEKSLLERQAEEEEERKDSDDDSDDGQEVEQQQYEEEEEVVDATNKGNFPTQLEQQPQRIETVPSAETEEAVVAEQKPKTEQ